MSRALDIGLVLLLAGGLALGGAPAAFAGSREEGRESDDHRASAHRASAEVSFVALTQRGHERRGEHFRATRVRVLKIEVDWLTLVGAHTQQLELITPDGSIYQRFNVPVESVTGRATVETPVPVAGTWITQHSLEGEWQVRVYLDEAVTPVTTATFTLAK